jgi:HAD superfamily hydrolase (TIGR01484 family)
MENQQGSRWLLVSDVDGTLTGDDEGLRALSGVGSQVTLVLNSSRPRKSLELTLKALPEQLRIGGVISAMGTEILLDGVEQVEWSRQFEGWDRALVDKYMAGLGMRPHEEEMQAPFKASFEVPASKWERCEHEVIELMPTAKVITSGESDFDVIPALAGKDGATQWVAHRLGFPPSHVIVAGDSANDLAMFESANMAIAVGNARRELIDAAGEDRTFFAERCHAFGVIEGLRHWGAIS